MENGGKQMKKYIERPNWQEKRHVNSSLCLPLALDFRLNQAEVANFAE